MRKNHANACHHNAQGIKEGARIAQPTEPSKAPPTTIPPGALLRSLTQTQGASTPRLHRNLRMATLRSPCGCSSKATSIAQLAYSTVAVRSHGCVQHTRHYQKYLAAPSAHYPCNTQLTARFPGSKSPPPGGAPHKNHLLPIYE